MVMSLLSSWFSYTRESVQAGIRREVKPTMIHLFPSSSSVRAGFFWMTNEPGLALRGGGAFFTVSGTTLLARNSGFLCVI